LHQAASVARDRGIVRPSQRSGEERRVRVDRTQQHDSLRIEIVPESADRPQSVGLQQHQQQQQQQQQQQKSNDINLEKKLENKVRKKTSC